jgi:hypothetical protein
MPSAEYFRRQADVCLRLSLASSEDEVSARLIAMAQEYRARADAMEADSKSMPGAAEHSGSPEGNQNES